MPRQPPLPAKPLKFPEQAKLRPMLASVFPKCNVLVAARIMGVTKGNAAMMIDGRAWLSRERALRLAKSLSETSIIVTEILRLAERERVERRGKSHVLDEASGRWRDERISRGKIRPKQAPESGEEP